MLEPQFQNYYLNPSGNIGFSYRIIDHLSIKAEINALSLSAERKDEIKNTIRTFKSFNIDYAMMGTLDLFSMRRIDGLFHKWNLQLFGGVGQVIFFPNNNKPGDNKMGEIIQDTTSITTVFTNIALIFPIGMGVQYYIDKNHFISLEGNYRFARTDFLDAVKDSSDPANDAYFTFQFKYTVIIDPDPSRSMRYEDYLRRKKKKNPGN